MATFSNRNLPTKYREEIRVIKGGSTTLTAEIPEAQRGQTPLTTASSNHLNGLLYIWYNLAQVHDHRSLQAETATAVHEVGHLFGAPDHYSGAPNGWTLTGLNDLTNGNPFSAICIYGDQKEDPAVINNITICDGCKKVIRQEIILPDTPV